MLDIFLITTVIGIIIFGTVVTYTWLEGKFGWYSDIPFIIFYTIMLPLALLCIPIILNELNLIKFDFTVILKASVMIYIPFFVVNTFVVIYYRFLYNRKLIGGLVVVIVFIPTIITSIAYSLSLFT